MTLMVAAVAGFLAGRFLWVLLGPTFADQPALRRENYRGHLVVTAAGVVAPLALVLVEGGRAVAGTLGAGTASGPSGPRLAVLVVVLGFGLLGLLDDLAGNSGERGFRGHVAALGRGRLTTGGAKLVGGVAVALVAVAPSSGGSTLRLLTDAALVALTANLANLLDRRPGRATKAAVSAFAVLALATAGATVLAGAAVAVGATAALLLDDLRERLMLGDAGANAAGAAVGLGLVLACAPGTRTIALLVVVALNGASEVVSFSRVIDAVPPLRALDRAGRGRVG